MTRRWIADTAFKSLAVAGCALLLALAGVSWLAISTSEQLLFPELARKSAAEAEQVRRKIDHALRLGIPPDRLAGLDVIFGDLRSGDGDIAFLATTDASDRVLHAHGIAAEALLSAIAAPARRSLFTGLAASQSLRGDYLITALPLRVGTLYVGHNEQALAQPLVDNLFDIGVILLVAMLLAFEVMLVVLTVNISQPAQAAAAVLRSVVARRFDVISGFGGPDELGRFIGRIAIFDTYSTVDLPFGMPEETLRLLHKSRVGNKTLKLQRMVEPGDNAGYSSRESKQGTKPPKRSGKPTESPIGKSRKKAAHNGPAV